MKRLSYDKRMNPIDNFRFGLWRPFLCQIKGHNFTCYKIVPTDPQEYVYMCNRCVIMLNKVEPCGHCTNGCKDRKDNK